MRAAAATTLAAFALSTAASEAAGGRPALEGFTGQLTTPSAWTIAPGTAHLLYTDAEDPRFRERGTTRTYALTLGLLRYTEISGRLTELRPQPALRDLSFNVKLQVPLDLLAPRLPIAFAIGGQDEGGAATNFATRYAVASVRLWRLTASVGWGRGPDRMEGPFGGGTLGIVDWLEVVGDWDGADLNAGLRASIPLDAVGLPFRLGAIAKSAIRHEPRAVQWGATLEVPLWLHAGPEGRRLVDLGAPPPPSLATAPAAAPTLDVRTASTEDAPPRGRSPALPEAPHDSGAEAGVDSFLELEDALVEIGFEEVRAGRAGDVVVVEYENNLFNHDEADALSVVLRRIELAGLASRPLAVVVKRNGLRVAEISVPGTDEPASAPVRSARPRSSADPRWRYGPSPRTVSWISPSPRNRSAMHAKLVLAPGLRTFVGTEVGALDWLVSFRPDLIVPLWPGATGFARANIPVAWSDDLRDRGVFRQYRQDNRLEYALVHQALPLAPGLMAMVGGGVVFATDAGGLGELLWSAFDGALALGVQGSWTANDRMEDRRAGTGSVRVRIAPLDVSAVVRAGRFVNGDRGGTMELSRWFGDAQIGVYFTKTEVAMAGAFFTIPLTPRKDMRPGWLQVRGSRRWGHGIGTVVGQDMNPITSGLAIAPVAPWNLESSYLDWGRISRDGLVEPVRALPALSR
jgi:hypothetical protein